MLRSIVKGAVYGACIGSLYGTHAARRDCANWAVRTHLSAFSPSPLGDNLSSSTSTDRIYAALTDCLEDYPIACTVGGAVVGALCALFDYARHNQAARPPA